MPSRPFSFTLHAIVHGVATVRCTTRQRWLNSAAALTAAGRYGCITHPIARPCKRGTALARR